MTATAGKDPREKTCRIGAVKESTAKLADAADRARSSRRNRSDRPHGERFYGSPPLIAEERGSRGVVGHLFGTEGIDLATVREGLARHLVDQVFIRRRRLVIDA